MRHNLMICNYTKTIVSTVNNIVPVVYSEFILEVGDSGEIAHCLTSEGRDFLRPQPCCDGLNARFLDMSMNTPVHM